MEAVRFSLPCSSLRVMHVHKALELTSIPPRQIRISQFEAIRQSNAVDPNVCGDSCLVTIADGEPTCAEDYNAARQDDHIAQGKSEYADAAARVLFALAPPHAFQGKFAPRTMNV